jgi:DNA polymerase-3 subunit epsilon
MVQIQRAPRPRPLAPRISPEEQAAHAAFIAEMGEAAIWKKFA